MKKTLFTFLILITALLLVACNKDSDKITGELEIVSKNFTGNTYSYVLNAEGTFSDDEVIEIAYSASSDIYEQLMDDIGSLRRVLKVTLQVNSSDKIDLVFNINFNLENPGLSFVSQHLK